jgi:hypothetical protein
MSSVIEVRRFDRPDDKLDMKDAGAISILKLTDGTTGMHATFEPGWTWGKGREAAAGFAGVMPDAPHWLLYHRHLGGSHGRH